MAQKIIISKPSYNALTETNIDNIVFSSDYNTLKYYAQGTATVNVPASSGGYYNEQSNIYHGLGYKPFFKVYANWIGYSPVGIFYLPSLDYSSYLGAVVDDEYIYFVAAGYVDVFGGGMPEFTATFKYKLFKNNLGL